MAKKNKENKYYSVRRYWTVCDNIVVKAKNADEANEKAMDAPLSPYPDYVSGSITNDQSVDVVGFEVIGGKKT